MKFARSPAVVVVLLLLVSVIVGVGFLTLERHLAPLPGQGATGDFDETVDDLEASTFRWVVIYLPAFQMAMCSAVGLLIAGRWAWLQNALSSLFILALVFVHHATISFTIAGVALPLYMLGGMLLATRIRRVNEGRGPETESGIGDR